MEPNAALSSPPPPTPVLEYLTTLGFDTKPESVSFSKPGGYPIYHHSAWPRSEGRFEDSYPHHHQQWNHGVVEEEKKKHEGAFNPLWVSAVRRVACTAVWSRLRASSTNNGSDFELAAQS